MRISAFLVAGLGLIGMAGSCGGGSTSSRGAGVELPDGAPCPAPTLEPAAGYPAAHAPFPQVTYQSGGIVAAPEVVTVTFPGDGLASELEAFDDTVLESCWWGAVAAGYCETSGPPCVGTGSVPARAHVSVPTSPAPTYTDSIVGGPSTLQTFVQQQVASGVLPAPDAHTVYALYFPSSTSIALDGAQTCVGLGGYHNAAKVSPPGGAQTEVPYAVIPRCDSAMFLASFKSLFDEVTFDASHEITEAITDPFVGFGKVGFYLPQNLDSVPWNVIGGGEIADLCVDYVGEAVGAPDDQRTAITSSGSYTVQRIWSNTAAAAGGDPCVPVTPGEVYFNIAIVEGSGTLQLAVGQSATFQAVAFSTGPLSWTVSGQDLSSLGGGDPLVDVAVSPSTVQNGDRVQVTVKLLSQPPSLMGTSVPGEPYLLLSKANGRYSLWPGVVLAQ